jgi:hypothetical protein
LIDIQIHMLMSREERQTHIDLTLPCVERGVSASNRHHVCRGILAYFLNTSIPSGRLIFCCHACNNWKCSEPRHLYWGTPADNTLDQIESGTFDIPAVRSRKKHGEEVFQQLVLAASSAGGRANAGKPKAYPVKNGSSKGKPGTPRTWNTGSRKGIKMPRSWSRQRVARPPATTT